ncbi:cellulose binding domain-containing protein [Asanoa sp. NPDC050611]|uniref:cellulose binding domain-containing protein n=1 Tax=Asanoa sp. NPDC050611 TaxID=3157098 RepID=UPI0033C1A3C4
MGDAARGVAPAAGIVMRDLLAGRRRQVLGTAAAVVVLGAAGAGLAATRGDRHPDTSTTTTVAAPAAAADTPACEVRYALRRDSGKAFDADLTVVNAGSAPVTDWSLAFTYPGDQKLTGAATATVDQQGNTVVLRPAGKSAVPAGGSAGVRLTGSYARSNAFPVEFRLDGAFCAPRLSSIATTEPVVRKAAVPKPKPAGPKAKDDSSGKGPGPKSGKGKGKGKG